MQNRSVWFVPGSASVSDAGERVSRSRTLLALRDFPRFALLRKSVSARRPNQHPRRLRSPIRFAAVLVLLPLICLGQQPSPTASPIEADMEQVVVSATRFDIPLDQSPASVSVITSQDLEQKQIQRVSDALREVPGLSVVQTGTAGQLTSVFMRGLRSEHTQVLLDGIPINQGLQGAFNFADLTTDDIDRIEVVRGPQSTLYGPRALAGVIQIFTKRGTGTPGILFAAEGGSYDTSREWTQSDGAAGGFDYSIGASRLDTDNARPNNNYRNTAMITDVGWSPNLSSLVTNSAVANEQLRIGTLFTYSVSDTGNPNTIFDPRPIDHFLTERWLIGPHIDWSPTEWWDHKLIVSYDHERQINDPNEDGFVGPTRALFERTQVDYQNDLRPASWLTLTSGFFYSRLNAGQERPFVLQIFGPQPTFVSDHTNETAGFLQTTLTPIHNLIFVAGGRFDHFNQFDDVWTYRFASSYKIDKTDTTLHSSVATGFSPPSSQDKIFGNNFGLKPEHDLGWDIGVEQRLWQNRVVVGLTYFHNDLSNVIGFNGLFDTLNLGAAETQGLEAEMHAQPIAGLMFSASYTSLDAEKTSSKDISQLQGARLPRRPRNEIYISASYLWWKKLRTVVEAKFVNAREELNFGGPNFDIEDYSFVNIAAEYEVNPHLSIFGRIDNLADEQYSEVFGFPALGRAAYGGVKLRF
ncbi:MAG TPA: TonB-dependent receptor [Candidatus Udaeobacter sp.]|nr:TonB-dependent receptor [Candidatus Udaeobacter sp.]